MFRRLIIIMLILFGMLSIAEAAPQWEATIWVASGDGNLRLALGADETATDGFDNVWDSYAMLGGQLRPYFYRPDWHPVFKTYWRDIRAKAPGNTTEWLFVIESSMTIKDVKITWDLSRVPKDYSLSLIDDTTGQTIDMRTRASYNFVYASKRNFRVSVYAPPEVVVQPNRSPVANAGPDQAIELPSCDGATVTLDGSASADPDGDALTYIWSWEGGSAEGANPVIALPMGVTTITLTVDDGKGLSSTDTVNISINDTTAAVLDVSASPDELWPPNHKYVKVTPTVTVYDACIPKTEVELISVTSNEPDDGLGDGDTENDIVINPDGTILLRAERSGGGNGRIYSINYVATDMGGNQTYGTAEVVVPLNRGKN